MSTIFQTASALCARGREAFENFVFSSQTRNFFELDRKLKRNGFIQTGWADISAYLLAANPRSDVQFSWCIFTNYTNQRFPTQYPDKIAFHIAEQIGGSNEGQILLCLEKTARAIDQTIIEPGMVRTNETSTKTWVVATYDEYKSGAPVAQGII